ncbi:alpha-ketoglutarate-dependent taurine dioxygenase [Bradyrhizobium japonicum]|uniref:TauD/TfdA dioxygenase family protein n=1 Tax=Bradyrhizobium elkanii TaxID=29448 RepID=UPI00037A0AB6|nr:TauD/TfdA family dioxygenase [Bradyrhizobium elkanii]MBP2435273.1 taurine dioxygenase [Bradyrhizobium elkanii]MCP1737565.1 taurine dioxygenase [Bradyrhizobium elkanii]MCS3576122.1 taurine dioxygenase [Bradyrhizobium elkanii]MCS3594543.1 taurine dioxygenase [Bradyrhizobium elkanii]MCS3626132.1 taurine dioxygenase [Bradyrhizobium elkanii]
MSERALIDSVISPADIVKRSGRIGAEILNIKLSGDLPEQTIAAINGLMLEYKVIFFREQAHLDDVEQERFACRFGKALPPTPTVSTLKGTISMIEIDAVRGLRADCWHIDMAYMEAYPKILVLRGVVIPPTGGDTVWANTTTAYLDLPPPLQRLADDLWVVHSNAFDPAIFPRPTEADKKHYEKVLKARLETEHPLVRVHPETGERALVLGMYAKRFVDVPKYDGQRLFDLFESHIIAPENTLRWNWRQDDVVIWDNRATMHYAAKDYGDQPRLVRRAAIDGEVPIGVNGRRSVARVKQQSGNVV